MTASGQLQMFEPEGRALLSMVSKFLQMSDQQFKRAENLALCGFTASSAQSIADAVEAYKNAQICEMTFQFEQLAELA